MKKTVILNPIDYVDTRFLGWSQVNRRVKIRTTTTKHEIDNLKERYNFTIKTKLVTLTMM